MGEVINLPRPSEDPEHDVVAAGPITIHSDGLRPMRVVLRDLSSPGKPKYVIHNEYFNEKTGAHEGYSYGQYFEGTTSPGTLFLKALDVFVERLNTRRSEYKLAADAGKLRRVASV